MEQVLDRGDIFIIRKPKATTELTQRESEILELLAEGWRNQSIADKLYIDIRTVKSYVFNIFCKVKANNNTEGKNIRVFTTLLFLLSQGKL